jgi:hypothetical protein
MLSPQPFVPDVMLPPLPIMPGMADSVCIPQPFVPNVMLPPQPVVPNFVRPPQSITSSMPGMPDIPQLNTHHDIFAPSVQMDPKSVRLKVGEKFIIKARFSNITKSTLDDREIWVTQFTEGKDHFAGKFKFDRSRLKPDVRASLTVTLPMTALKVGQMTIRIGVVDPKQGRFTICDTFTATIMEK